MSDAKYALAIRARGFESVKITILAMQNRLLSRLADAGNFDELELMELESNNALELLDCLEELQ